MKKAVTSDDMAVRDDSAGEPDVPRDPLVGRPRRELSDDQVLDELLQVTLPDDETPGVADRRDVHPSLGEDPASGNVLARWRFRA